MVSDLRKLQAMENTVAGLNRALTNCTNELTECHRKLARETENLDNSNSHIRELRNKITELTELRVTAALNTQTVLDMVHSEYQRQLKVLEGENLNLRQSLDAKSDVTTFTSIQRMCAILKDRYIEASEYTDCTVLYEVTFEQLRGLYDLGRCHGSK